MDSPDPSPERLERVKQVLADSYPQVPDVQREGLPASVLEALGESVPQPVVSEAKGGVFERLAAFLRGPQLVGLGAAAVLMIVAVVLLRPGDGNGGGPGGNGGMVMRGTPGSLSGPPLIVFQGLSQEDEETLQSSDSFQPEQLLKIEESRDLATFLAGKETQEALNLVLVDGATGRLSAPLLREGAPEPRPVDAEGDLVTTILLMLAEMPTAEEEEGP